MFFDNSPIAIMQFTGLVDTVVNKNLSKQFDENYIDSLNQWIFGQAVNIFSQIRNQFVLDNIYKLKYNFIEHDGVCKAYPSEELVKMFNMFGRQPVAFLVEK